MACQMPLDSNGCAHSVGQIPGDPFLLAVAPDRVRPAIACRAAAVPSNPMLPVCACRACWPWRTTPVPFRHRLPPPPTAAVSQKEGRRQSNLDRPSTLLTFMSGSDLLSQAVASQVPSALAGFTSVFGKGTGGSPPLSPPDKSSIGRPTTSVRRSSPLCRSRRGLEHSIASMSFRILLSKPSAN